MVNLPFLPVNYTEEISNDDIIGCNDAARHSEEFGDQIGDYASSPGRAY